MRVLRAEGHSLRHLLECSGLRRSTYYYALAHPRRPTRPELRDAAAEIFSRTANGCGHRQIAMCLRAELGAVVADKTVLKMMREMGIRCGIRRRGSRRRYSSYRGLVGSTFENVIARDFGADGPWQKLGTDVTEFKVAGAKAYWAPVLDFCTKEIVASDISTSPDLAQQHRMLDRLLEALPDGAAPTMHSDMGWQYQHESYASRLEGGGHHPKHVTQGELHRQRRHRAALRPREGRVLPRQGVGQLRGLQARPGGVHSPLEHAAQAGKIEGPDAGGVPEPGPCGVVAIYSVQVSGRSSPVPFWRVRR